MGITIKSKRFSADMSAGGFYRFRKMVASQVSDEVLRHYENLDSVFCLSIGERVKFFEDYDKKTEQLVAAGEISVEVANFLYQSDVEGKIDRRQVKQIYELIKDTDDNIVYGYIGREDCAKMKDMKNIFSDKTIVKWL